MVENQDKTLTFLQRFFKCKKFIALMIILLPVMNWKWYERKGRKYYRRIWRKRQETSVMVSGLRTEGGVSLAKHQCLRPCCVIRSCSLPKEPLLTGNHEETMTNRVWARPMCYLSSHTQLQLQTDCTNYVTLDKPSC